MDVIIIIKDVRLKLKSIRKQKYLDIILLRLTIYKIIVGIIA